MDKRKEMLQFQPIARCRTIHQYANDAMASA